MFFGPNSAGARSTIVVIVAQHALPATHQSSQPVCLVQKGRSCPVGVTSALSAVPLHLTFQFFLLRLCKIWEKVAATGAQPVPSGAPQPTQTLDPSQETSAWVFGCTWTLGWVHPCAPIRFWGTGVQKPGPLGWPLLPNLHFPGANQLCWAVWLLQEKRSCPLGVPVSSLCWH